MTCLAGSIPAVTGEDSEREELVRAGIDFLEATASKVESLGLWYRFGEPVDRGTFISTVQRRLGLNLGATTSSEIEAATRHEAGDLLTIALSYEITDPVRREHWVKRASRPYGVVHEAEDAVHATWERMVNGLRGDALSVLNFRKGHVPSLQVMFTGDDVKARFNVVLHAICTGIKRAKAKEEAEREEESSRNWLPHLSMEQLGDVVIARHTLKAAGSDRDPVPDGVDEQMMTDAARSVFHTLAGVIGTADFGGPLLSPDLRNSRPANARRDFNDARVAANRFLSA
jgi:hypothetical protein